MEAISRAFRVALPWKLLYAADLAVIAETEDDLIKRLNEWKNNVDSKGMRLTVNMNKTHTFNGPFFQDYPGEPVPKGKANLDFTEARDSEWQWHQLGHMQVCTSL